MNDQLDLSAVVGGVEISVTHLNGLETVKVRYLPVGKYPAFAAALQDEAAQVALFCDKDRDWAEGLHPQSHDEIIVKGHELNLPFFERWVSRQLKTHKLVDPGAEARTERIIKEAVLPEVLRRLDSLAASPSASSSPASAPAPASPGNT